MGKRNPNLEHEQAYKNKQNQEELFHYFSHPPCVFRCHHLSQVIVLHQTRWAPR